MVFVLSICQSRNETGQGFFSHFYHSYINVLERYFFRFVMLISQN